MICFILFSGFLGAGVNWLIQIISDLIFTTIQSKPVSTELPLTEIGDPDKYQVSEKKLLNHLKSVVFSLLHPYIQVIKMKSCSK